MIDQLDDMQAFLLGLTQIQRFTRGADGKAPQKICHHISKLLLDNGFMIVSKEEWDSRKVEAEPEPLPSTSELLRPAEPADSEEDAFDLTVIKPVCQSKVADLENFVGDENPAVRLVCLWRGGKKLAPRFKDDPDEAIHSELAEILQ